MTKAYTVEEIRTIMEVTGIRQSQLAEMMEITKQMLHYLLEGKISVKGRKRSLLLATYVLNDYIQSVLGVDIDNMLEYIKRSMELSEFKKEIGFQ